MQIWMDVIPWYSVVSGGQDRADLTANLSNGSEDRNDIRSPGYIDTRTLVVGIWKDYTNHLKQNNQL